MGTLEQLRDWRPGQGDGRSDFDDLPPATYRPRVEREMIRMVEGADDLARPSVDIPNLNAGMVTIDPNLQRRDTRPFKDAIDEEPMRDAQRGKIWHLMNDLRKLDPTAGATADEWWGRQTDVLKVQASEWINRLKARIAATLDGGVVPIEAPPVAPVRKTNAWAEWRELAAKLAIVGGSRGTRFAVDTDPGAVNTLAFWRISPSQDRTRFYLNQIIGGQGAVKVRMSPEAMVAIANKIITAGPVEAMIRYGKELGECGHCGRELTNDVSRGKGIGPHCEKHMGGWN